MFNKFLLFISCKDYIQRQRTVNVDVDSKGRSCKERMLRVLTEEALSAQQRFVLQ